MSHPFVTSLDGENDPSPPLVAFRHKSRNPHQYDVTSLGPIGGFEGVGLGATPLADGDRVGCPVPKIPNPAVDPLLLGLWPVGPHL